MLFQKKKNWIGGVGGGGLANPSFSRIFWFFLTWQDPLICVYRPIECFFEPSVCDVFYYILCELL